MKRSGTLSGRVERYSEDQLVMPRPTCWGLSTLYMRGVSRRPNKHSKRG